MVILRDFSLDVRLAGFLKRFLNRLAMLGLEQVSNVVPHVVCQHSRMSWLRTLQHKLRVYRRASCCLSGRCNELWYCSCTGYCGALLHGSS